MRSIWIYLSSVALVVAIGGAVYHFTPQPQADMTSPGNSELQTLPDQGRTPLVSAGNPLLAASELQLDLWIPIYPIPCGDIVFGAADDPARHFSFCVREIRNRVFFHANLELSDEDVLDPRVSAHWRATVRRR